MFKSARFSAHNVALWHVLASVLMLAIFAVPLWYAWHGSIAQGRATELRDDARRLAALAQQQGPAALRAAIAAQPGQGGRRIMLLTDRQFLPLAGNLARWPDRLGRQAGPLNGAVELGGRTVEASLWHEVLPGGEHLLVGLDIARFRRLEHLFLAGLLACAVAVVLIALAGGLVIRRTLLARVEGISRASAAIVSGDLSHRLPHYQDEDELALLTRTINSLLEQIEHHVLAAQNISSAIAHDLRTPLAELRSRLEMLAITRPAPAETFEEVDGAIADTDHVISIFNAMLRLAEIDSGSRRAGFVKVALHEVVLEVAEFYQPVAEVNGIGFACAPIDPVWLAGDPVLLAQAAGNLIENALKYTPRGGTIMVSLRADAARVHLTVADNGPGIPEAEKARVFERFYRCDASRGTDGLGLGLSVVAAVARLHDGEVALADNEPGLSASLCVPASSAKK
ncbi:MAG: sensor histidine kinase [Massilia sp.]